MSIVIMVGQLILGLSILIILHELGHFLAARAFGIKVDKFYLFFDAWGISLFKFNFKGVEYGIGWLPLGGYVKIAGMIDESMDTEQLAGPPQPWEFRSKPAWQRLIVMLGGVTVNIILGVLIFWVLTIKYGETYTPIANVKYGIVPGKIGMKLGLKAGDQVIAINGNPVARFEELTSSQVIMGNTDLTVQRDDQTLHVKVPANLLNDIADQTIDAFISRYPRMKFAVGDVEPKSGAEKAGLQKGDSILAVNGNKIAFFNELQDQLGQNKNHPVKLSVYHGGSVADKIGFVNKDGILGFKPVLDTPKTALETFSFFGSLPVGATKAWGSFTNDAKGIGKIVKGEVKFNKAVMGPVGMATIFGPRVDWLKFWSLVGILSMVLAVTNLLPIPALDGGHAVFLIIEMIKGKPLSDKFLERAQIVGFVILITLMVFVFGNDIIRQFKK
jgi:regulator of sigma E protease